MQRASPDPKEGHGEPHCKRGSNKASRNTIQPPRQSAHHQAVHQATAEPAHAQEQHQDQDGALSPAWLDFAGPAPHALQLAVYFRFPGQVLARLLIFNHGKILLYKMGNSSESTRRPL